MTTSLHQKKGNLNRASMASPAMIRTWRRWPIMLALPEWWLDPQQAAAMIMVAGCRIRGRKLQVHQRDDLTFRIRS